MAVSDKPWGQFSETDYADAGAYCDACLINTNSGPRSTWTKANCKLPVKEPDGALNRGGVHAAASVMAGGRGGVRASPAMKRAAARRLMTMYRADLNEAPPESLMAMVQ